MSTQQLSECVLARLRCPKCRQGTLSGTDGVACENITCRARYPAVKGTLVLIDEHSSVFSLQDFTEYRQTYFRAQGNGFRLARVNQLLPKIGRNVRAANNYSRVRDLLLQQSKAPQVLVLGGSILGDGLEYLANHSTIKLVETDVAFGPRTVLICDAHSIPFEDETFDGVIVQAVLEHVVDPYACVNEICRVLKPQGLVYAETPFMQQVHGGRYDFTRFTDLGHRRLFRRFEEISRGAGCGPGMALAWSWQYFLLSFAQSRPIRGVIRAVAALTSFWLKYFDGYLVLKPGGLDAASGLYFLGRKSDKTLDDKDLICSYKGAAS